MFPISKCSGDTSAGLCIFWVLVHGESLRNEGLGNKRSGFPLYSDIRNIYQICTDKLFPSARRLLPADMLEHWLQVCRVKITFRLLLKNSFVSTTMNSMNCLVNWIPLTIRVCSRNTQPHLNHWTFLSGYWAKLMFKRQQWRPTWGPRLGIIIKKWVVRSWLNHCFLSFFLRRQRPNLINGLSGWSAPDHPSFSQFVFSSHWLYVGPDPYRKGSITVLL